MPVAFFVFVHSKFGTTFLLLFENLFHGSRESTTRRAEVAIKGFSAPCSFNNQDVFVEVVTDDPSKAEFRAKQILATRFTDSVANR